MKRKGSITIYACLMLAVLLSFLLVILQSVKLAAARVEISAAADLGMYSLFARYEPKMLEWYDLFLFDGGYGNGILRQDKWYQCVKQDTMQILQPEAGEKLRGNRLTDIQVTKGGVSGYALAGDWNSAAISAQILSYMKQNLGISGISLLAEQFRTEEHTLENQKVQEEQLRQTQNEYEAQTAQTQQPTADFVNPIEVIQKLQKQGILALVLSEDKEVSKYSVQSSSLYSKREKQHGIGIAPPKTESADRFVLAEYLKEKCRAYTNASKTPTGLQYQLEYILNGKMSDLENLKSTVNKLLLVREASNLVFLVQNPGKRAEAEAMGTGIAGALLVPEAAPAITKLLQFCWAFGESVLDIRELLDGGKIAPIKDEASWQLDLDALAELLQKGNEYRHSSAKGLSYPDYISLLLLAENQQKVLDRFLDIAELRLRTEGEKPGFHIDCCVTVAEMELDCLVEKKYSYTVRRGFGYGEQ